MSVVSNRWQMLHRIVSLNRCKTASSPCSKQPPCTKCWHSFPGAKYCVPLATPGKSPALADLTDQCPTQRCRELDAAHCGSNGHACSSHSCRICRVVYVYSFDCASNYSALRAFGALAINSRAPCFVFNEHRKHISSGKCVARTLYTTLHWQFC